MNCASNLKSLAFAILAYSHDHDGKHPTPGRWCDLLVGSGNVNDNQFVCPGGKDDRGPSNYAINPNAEPNSPARTVLFFETKGGWNQFGGPEILTTENHERKGCYVAFVDTSVRFIKTKDLSQLKWKPDEDK
jgi:hypothetical protein